jgi:hypothetical protein
MHMNHMDAIYFQLVGHTFRFYAPGNPQLTADEAPC